MKKKLLSTLIIIGSTFTSSASASSYCYIVEKNSTESYSFIKKDSNETEYCLSKEGNRLILKEDSFLYGENEYILKGLSSTNISKIKSVTNNLGNIHLITEEGDLYTGKVGYVLSNNDYIALNKNNVITLTLQGEVKDTVKSFEYDDIVALDSNGTVRIHSQKSKKLIDKGWEEVQVGKAIDIAMNDLGSYFILTKRGVFSRLKDTDVDLIKGKSTRSTYERNGVYYLFDKLSVRNIPLEKLRINYIYNSRHGTGITIELKHKDNGKRYYVDVSKNSISLTDELRLPQIPKSKKTEVIKYAKDLVGKLKISTASNISIEKRSIEKSGKKVDVATLRTNQLMTRDYGRIELSYKENVFLMDSDITAQTSFSDYEEIVYVRKIKGSDEVLVLRENGVLRKYNLSNYKLISTDFKISK